jgi:hypothetical protein
MKTKHQLAMEIVKTLIESGLSINGQLKVINEVRNKLNFCRETGQEMAQHGKYDREHHFKKNTENEIQENKKN